MAEIVGLIASVVQLVDTVAKAHDCIQDFRSAPKEQRQLLLEVQSLEPLIRELDERIKKRNAAGLRSGMQEFEKPLLQLKGTMERLAKKLDVGGTRKVTSRLTWPLWGKDDVQEGLNTIERFKNLLDVWLGMDIWNSTQDTASAVKIAAREQRQYHDHARAAFESATEEQRIHHNDILTSVEDVARNQERYYSSAERDAIIKWYSPLNFFLRHADILGSRQTGTGEWLLKTDQFQEWKLGRGKKLWCRGMPGAGKTVLASIVVENLRVELESQNIGVAVIYLNHKEIETQTPSNLLSALWRQLIFRKPISEDVHRLYETHQEWRRPSLEDTYSILCSTVSEFSRVFIVVDALDEYPERQRHSLLRRLSLLGPNVNLMMMSRPHIDTFLAIPTLETLEIRAKEEDIRRYLEAQILDSLRLSKHIKNCPALREEIEEQIVRRSDGMFLLAKLHIDSLTTKHTVKAVQDTLKNMPNDLDRTYDQVVERINRQSDDDKHLAWLVLSWITLAKRPLRHPELTEALAVKPGDTEVDTRDLLDMDTILSVCAGLVIIKKEDDTICLIHHTIQHYLERIQDKAFPHASSRITTTCIIYLSFNSLDMIQKVHQLMTRNSFLDYAVEYCLIHARGEPETHIGDLILSFLDNCDVWFKLWSWNNKYDGRHKSADSLSIATVFGLEKICRHLVGEGGGPTFPQSDVSSYLSGSNYAHRGSIFTQATSLSEWSSDKLHFNVDSDMEEEKPDRLELIRRRRDVYRLSDFIIQRTLGTGNFGRVHLVRSKHNLRFYAIKILNKERVVRMKQVEHTNNEQRVLECVQHPFIVNLWGYFQDSANLYMLMDFVPGGELFTLLRRSRRFPDPVAKFYAAEVGLALNYLHGLGVIYRDLKPENVLLNADGHIKIVDFGFAKAADATTWTLCGAPDYLAPEIIGQQRYNKSVDWYALGILIYEMLFGLPPYHQAEQNHMALYDRIQAGPSKVTFPPAAFSDQAKDLIMKLMVGDPSKRFGNMRNGAADVFAHQWFREVHWTRLEAREIAAPYLPRIAGDGDANAFDKYPEDDASSTYGLPSPDCNGALFPDFQYTAIS